MHTLAHQDHSPAYPQNVMGRGYAALKVIGRAYRNTPHLTIWTTRSEFNACDRLRLL